MKKDTIEEKYAEFINTLNIADAVINRDYIIFQWWDKKYKEQQALHRKEADKWERLNDEHWEKRLKKEKDELIKYLIDNNSLKGKSNGRYNREIELREKIKNIT